MTTSPTLTSEHAQRLYRALTGDSAELFHLVHDAPPEVLFNLLKNPNLREEHLLALLKRRDLPEDLPKAIHQLPQEIAGHRTMVALAGNPKTPPAVLHALLPQLHLFELLHLCILAGPAPDQKAAAERVIIQRLPTTPLGNKITLARRGTSSLLAALLCGGEPDVVEACLDSPRLREITLVQLINGPHASAETISRIARHTRWQHSRNLQLTILRHPKTPGIWFSRFLPHLPVHEVRTLRLSNRLTPVQKQLIDVELHHRGTLHRHRR